MENTRQAEEIIKTTARKYIPDADVVLFGSRARMTHDLESDYDILNNYPQKSVSQAKAAI